MTKARQELEDLVQNTETRELSLGDKSVFAIRSGHRITLQHLRDNPGDIPVYSCNKDVETVKGKVSRSFLVAQDFKIETKAVTTINANGSVGVVFVREPECVVTDDVLIVEAKDDQIDPHFLALRLGDAATAAAVEYEAKLYQARLAELDVEIPVKSDGSFDLDRQRAISDATRRFDDAHRRLTLIGKWSEKARVA